MDQFFFILDYKSHDLGSFASKKMRFKEANATWQLTITRLPRKGQLDGSFLLPFILSIEDFAPKGRFFSAEIRIEQPQKSGFNSLVTVCRCQFRDISRNIEEKRSLTFNGALNFDQGTLASCLDKGALTIYVKVFLKTCRIQDCGHDEAWLFLKGIICLIVTGFAIFHYYVRNIITSIRFILVWKNVAFCVINLKVNQ